MTESKLDLNKKSFIAVLMIFLVVVLSFTFLLPKVKAADVKIVSFSPSNHRGHVGEKVQITGTLNTTAGSCVVWFNGQKVNETTADRNNVSAAFLVPVVPSGNYTVIMQDVSKNINATTFLVVEPKQYINVKAPDPPAQLQENEPVQIMVNVTGAVPNHVYLANVTVVAPANRTSHSFVRINATSTGLGYNVTGYPGDFVGTANTNYTGTYNAIFNATLIAADVFFVGLTNSSEYHRRQYVDIKAAGYNQTENATISIRFGTKLVYTENTTSDEGGLIHRVWPVPFNASIGAYTLNVTSTSTLNRTRKNPRDVQTFTIPGFSINVTTRNLAEETVPNVVVRVYENQTSVTNTTTGQNGFSITQLEVGDYRFEAVFKGVKVGERLENVTSKVSLNLSCGLTNMRILLMNKAGVRIPEVSIFFKPDNRTLARSDMNGTIIEHSLLPNFTKPYVLNASRYDRSFNVTTIPNLLVNGKTVKWFDLPIVCPLEALQVNFTKANGQPISNAKVRAQEFLGGLFYEGITDAQGLTVLNCTFGKYRLSVYDGNGIELNETTVELYQNKNISLVTRLYGLTVTISILDYFGQPIPGANVTMKLEDVIFRTGLTRSDGTMLLSDVTGETYQVAVRLPGQTEPCTQRGFAIDESTTAIAIKLDQYVMLFGFMVGTSQLALALIVVITIIVILALEIYRRKRAKSSEAES